MGAASPPISLYLGVATRSFRRYSTYIAATLAGVFTNSVFGVIISYVYIAVWTANPDAGGYDVTDAVTYVWLGQATLMTVAFWGGGAPSDLADRIRTGDVAIDFYRPVSILSWYLAADLGRAAYHLLTRGFAPMVVAAFLFDLRWPDVLGALAFLAAITLAVVVSFALRMLASIAAFWILDDAGPRTLLGFLAIFFGGQMVPLVLFPGLLRDVAMHLPWATYLQIPADLWLGQRTGWDAVGGLAQSVAWAVVLLAITQAVLRVAERKVVVQGG